MSISLEPPGILVDASLMRAVSAVDRLRVEVKRTRDLEALLPVLPPDGTHFRTTLEMNLDSCRVTDDDSSLEDLLLYFARRIVFRDFVIERYHADVLELANRLARVTDVSTASFWHIFTKYFSVDRRRLDRLDLA